MGGGVGFFLRRLQLDSQPLTSCLPSLAAGSLAPLFRVPLKGLGAMKRKTQAKAWAKLSWPFGS